MLENLGSFYPGDLVFRSSRASIIILSRKMSLVTGNVKYSIVILKNSSSMGTVLKDVTCEILSALIEYNIGGNENE